MPHFFVHRTKKDIINGVIWHFNSYLRNWKASDTYPSITNRDGIYLNAFREKLFLEKFGILPEEVVKIFDELTTLHIGKSVEEINKLTDKMADNNVRAARNKPLQSENYLTDEEVKIITEYHKYLFANPASINEKPFEMDL